MPKFCRKLLIITRIKAKSSWHGKNQENVTNSQEERKINKCQLHDGFEWNYQKLWSGYCNDNAWDKVKYFWDEWKHSSQQANKNYTTEPNKAFTIYYSIEFGTKIDKYTNLMEHSSENNNTRTHIFTWWQRWLSTTAWRKWRFH